MIIKVTKGNLAGFTGEYIGRTFLGHEVKIFNLKLSTWVYLTLVDGEFEYVK